MYRRTSLSMIAFLGSAALLAGCGSSSSGGSTASGGSSTGTGTGSGSNNSSQTASAELTSAVTALGNASTLTAAIKLGATPADITSLLKANKATLSPAEVNAIAGAQIAIEVSAPAGKKLSDLTSGATGEAVNFSISDNGTTFLSIRSVDKTLYLQADLKDLLNTIGQSSTYQGLAAETSALPSFIQALFAGKWVSLPESAASSLTGGLGASTGASANPAQEQQFITALQGILAKDVTVTRTSSGSTDQLALSANSQTLAKDLVTALSSAVPAAASELGSADPSSVPSRTIALTAAVTNGSLSQIAIDLGQFANKGKTSFPLDLNFTQGGAAITAPSGAVKVDTSQLGALFGGLAGGLGGSSG
jgi:hypothetical protein